jgi:hypothetical protein
MSRPTARYAGFTLALGIILSACGESTNPTTPAGPGGSPLLVGAQSTVGVVDTGEFEVCKYGSAATIEYSIDGGPTNSVALADGGCAVLGTTPTLGTGNHTITTTEVADPTIVLDSMVATINTIFNPAGTRGAPITGTATFSGTFNGDRGVLIEYYNSVLPPPPDGCTFTQGYWKNHTDVWPAPYTPDATFYGSGKTWLGVFNTPPKGNAYYILAHQFMAATLNAASGASVPANVQTALDDAAAYFADPVGHPLTSAQLVALAAILDSYNNGLEGVPHCDSTI